MALYSGIKMRQHERNPKTSTSPSKQMYYNVIETSCKECNMTDSNSDETKSLVEDVHGRPLSIGNEQIIVYLAVRKNASS